MSIFLENISILATFISKAFNFKNILSNNFLLILEAYKTLILLSKVVSLFSNKAIEFPEIELEIEFTSTKYPVTKFAIILAWTLFKIAFYSGIIINKVTIISYNIVISISL